MSLRPRPKAAKPVDPPTAAGAPRVAEADSSLRGTGDGSTTPPPGSTWNGPDPARTKLEMAGWLAGFMAHEVNNHLAAALIEIELSLQDPHSDDTRAMLERVLVAVESAGDVCRSTLGMLRPEHSVTTKAGLVGEAIGRTVACLGKVRSRVVVRAESSLELAATPLPLARLQQVLLNVLLNAIRASTGDVVLSVARAKSPPAGSTWNGAEAPRPNRDSWLCISVLDDGPGMPRSIAVQLASPPRPDSIELIDGGGFGLAAVKHLVTSVGGAVSATPLGARGTRVDILLPVVDIAPERQAA